MRRPHDDGRVGGQLREQPGRALEHGLHLAVDLVEEFGHLAPLRRTEDARRREVVDEEPVALVGRDTPGARVRLDQVPVALERHHLGADGGRRDLHPGGGGDVRRADRLGSPDVLAHDRLQDGGTARVELVLGSGRGVRLGGLGVTGHRWRLMVGAWHSMLPTASGSALGAPDEGEHRWPGAPACIGIAQSSPRRRAEMNASWGTSTRPMFFIRFFPSFCFSSSLRLRVMSPP